MHNTNLTAATIACAALLLIAPAHAINKCRTPDGKTIFQDAPCAPGQGGKIEVRPASGYAQPTAATVTSAAVTTTTTTPAKPQTEAQRIDAQAEVLRKENRLHTLQVRAIPDARAAVDRQKLRCDGDMAELKNKKQLATNNLAGATWEQSISSEMAATATRCDTESRTLTKELDTLLQEQEAIKKAIGK